MKEVTLYSADWCPYCNRAKKLLETKGVAYTEINVDQFPGKREEIVNKTGMKTIPQIFIGDHFVGGYSELSAIEASGELDTLLKS
ncbi:MAG: glutaredoxin 3 [Bdellovibrionales bacterium]|nr:glutaredoxin 3 [Bdellovibrionales bacterium]